MVSAQPRERQRELPLVAVALLAAIALFLTLFAVVNPAMAVVKETICHATGSTGNPYVAITISVEGGTENLAAHFNEDGSALSGHEQDFLLPEEATNEECAAAAFNLDITKSASASSVNAGGSFTYTITATNAGEQPATGVVVTDDLADSLTGVTASFSVDGGTAAPCTVGAGNTITCTVGNLAVDAVAVVTVNATTTLASCPSVVNTSTVDSNEQEAEDSNTVTVAVVCLLLPASPTLSLDKVVTGGDANTEFAFTWGAQGGAMASIGDPLSANDPVRQLANAAGTYVVTEGALGTDWNLAGIACTGNSAAATVSLATQTVTVTVGANEDVVCTFTNSPEGTLANNPSSPGAPSSPVTVRQGTLANTAMDGPGDPAPALVLALVALGSLAFVAHRNIAAIKQRS